jgi:hypothetical protein
VKAPAVKGTVGKSVEASDLKAAGVEVKVVPQQGMNGPNSQVVSFDVTGNVDAMQKIRLINKDGNDLPGNPSWNADPKARAALPGSRADLGRQPSAPAHWTATPGPGAVPAMRFRLAGQLGPLPGVWVADR